MRGNSAPSFQIVEFLKSHRDRWLAAGEIAEGCGCSQRAVRDQVKILESQSVLEKYDATYRYRYHYLR